MESKARMTWIDPVGRAWRIERITGRWSLSRYSPTTETWLRVGSFPTREAAIQAASGQQDGASTSRRPTGNARRHHQPGWALDHPQARNLPAGLGDRARAIPAVRPGSSRPVRTLPRRDRTDPTAAQQLHPPRPEHPSHEDRPYASSDNRSSAASSTNTGKPPEPTTSSAEYCNPTGRASRPASSILTQCWWTCLPQIGCGGGSPRPPLGLAAHLVVPSSRRVRPSR